MMKSSVRVKLFAVVCVCVIAALSASAEVELYHKWVRSDSTIKIGDTRLIAKWNDPVLLMTIGTGYLSLEKGSCGSVEPLRVCFNSTRLIKDGVVMPDDIHSSDVIVEMDITVYGLIADVNLSQSFEKRTLVIGESTEVTVRFANTGATDATAVRFSEEYPAAFSVTDVDGCSQSGTTISWNGTMHREQQETCTYLLRALTDKRYNAKAEVRYFNGVEDKAVTNVQLIEVLKSPLAVAWKVNASKILIGDNFTVNVSITNTHNETIVIDAVELTSTGMTNNRVLTLFHGELAAGESSNATLSFIAARSGEQNLSLRGRYLANDVPQTLEAARKILVSSDLSVEILSSISTLPLGKPAKLSVQLINPSTIRELGTVSGTVTSNLPGFENKTSSVEQLARKNGMTLLDQMYTPQVLGQYFLNISVTYESAFGEVFRKVDVRKVTVIGAVAGNELPSTDVSSEPNTSNQEPEKPHMQIKLPTSEVVTEDQTRVGGVIIIGGVLVSAALLIYLKFKVRSE
jgi:hypothetical protein